MNSLQAKCLAGSTAMHALLLLALFVGPWLFVSQQASRSLPALRMVSSRLVNEALASRPRNLSPPAVTEPAPAPVVPLVEQPVAPIEFIEPPRVAPAPQVTKAVTAPTPAIPPTVRPIARPVVSQPQPPNPQKAATAPPATKAAPARAQVTPNTKAISQVLQEQKKAAAAAAAQRTRQEADNQARTREALNELSSRVGRSTPGPSIEIPGAADAQSVDYALIVEQAYRRAWKAPAELSSSSAEVIVQVVIARDGRVVMGRTRITKRSGVRALDDSVERALKLESVEPFPLHSQDLERIFNIHFDLKSKAYSG